MIKKIIVSIFAVLTLFAPIVGATEKANITELNSNYQQITNKYYQALQLKWDKSSLLNNGMFQFLNMDGYQTSDCGYFTRDVDGNGIEELFIVHQSPNYKDGSNFIIDSYTLEGGSLKQLFCPTSQSEEFQITPDGHFLYKLEDGVELYHLNGSSFVLDGQREFGGYDSQYPPVSVSYFPFNMVNVPSGEGIPIYRVYNMFNGEHLYSSDLGECVTLMSRGWNSEGMSWKAPNSGEPVYRLCSPDGSQHLFTTDSNEVSELTAHHGWTADNNSQPLFYSGGSVPIYRLCDSKTGQHLLTRDNGEYNSLPSQGWIQEGSTISGLS